MQVSLLLVDWLHPQFQPRGDIFDGGTLCLGGVDISSILASRRCINA